MHNLNKSLIASSRMYGIARNDFLSPAFSTIRIIVTPNRLYVLNTLRRRLASSTVNPFWHHEIAACESHHRREVVASVSVQKVDHLQKLICGYIKTDTRKAKNTRLIIYP